MFEQSKIDIKSTLGLSKGYSPILGEGGRGREKVGGEEGEGVGCC